MKLAATTNIVGACLLSVSISSIANGQVADAIAAPDEAVMLTVHAVGAQIYECSTDSAGRLAWQFREPIAALFVDGETVGRHFAGPSWEMNDGSMITGKVTARAAGATQKDIPLLKLQTTSQQGKGQLSGITTIQRINTAGGAAEGTCGVSGAFLSIPYSADYRFLKRNGG